MMDEKHSDLAGRIGANFRNISGSDPLQAMSEDEVRSNWGGVLEHADLSPFGSFFLNPLAGWADAGRALTIMANEAIRMGVRYQVDEATHLVLGKGGIEGVKTKSGDLYSADKVLLCTGAWTSQLMSSIENELKMPQLDRVEVKLLQLACVLRTFNSRMPSGSCTSSFLFTSTVNKVGQMIDSEFCEN
jgi:Glycine/D-amino acid oxidases (deaminating)